AKRVGRLTVGGSCHQTVPRIPRLSLPEPDVTQWASGWLSAAAHISAMVRKVAQNKTGTINNPSARLTRQKATSVIKVENQRSTLRTKASFPIRDPENITNPSASSTRSWNPQSSSGIPPSRKPTFLQTSHAATPIAVALPHFQAKACGPDAGIMLATKTQ